MNYSTLSLNQTISKSPSRPKPARTDCAASSIKILTNDEIVDICGAVFDRGMLTVKLYMMVGLPTETQEDLDEMFVLVERIKNRMLEAGKKFGRAGKIIPSLNGFVPKPNTPLQWDAICDEKELKQKIKYVCKGLEQNSECRSSFYVGENRARTGTFFERRPDGFKSYRSGGKQRQKYPRNAPTIRFRRRFSYFARPFV